MAKWVSVEDVRIMAIDPGTEKLGWCFGVGNKLVEFGVLMVQKEADVTPTVLPFGDLTDPWHKVYALHQWCSHKFYSLEIEVVGIEIPMGDHNNRHADRVLASAFAGVYLAARKVNAIVEPINPATVKATGYHKNALRDATLLARKHLRDGMVTEDEADALGVWQATWQKVLHRHRMKHG